MARLEHIAQQRLEKLERIRGQGINPYPHSYHRSHTTAIRFMGKIAFFDIRDGSGKIQLHFSHDLLGKNKYELLHEIDIGDFIGAKGKLFRTKTGEITLEVNDFTLLAKSIQPLPENWHGWVDVEKRYRQRYLDLISNADVEPVFRLRSQIILALRRFLNEQGFIEVETPVLQSVAGGGLARPPQTHPPTLATDT